ncbi:hypothetical protein GQ607_012663 [Colletotrichum asianum]|uniref:Uncharacterized protein n=1 Tax=Colletotrichum asianum TaxID=702518 RepID=A0A8H3W4V5_9PEZI|nr:hypothetical protein GQ607_012663 [Colletotrichum asianum]
MDNDSSTCPEDSNSTDCLLRTLIRLVGDQNRADDAKIDWDPVTFVFTAIIGVIAIVFALIPVVQAFLTAGRANRRSSRRAIGSWSENRKRRWNKSEWTFDFVVQVPIFRSLSLQIKQWEIEREESDTSEEIRGPGPRNEKRVGRKYASQQTAATWPNFFRMVGLDGVVTQGEYGFSRSVDVGFLPDDLVAAPAYAEIGVIISTAALHPDTHTLLLEGTTGYPIILGRSFQFEFRQHPLLGLVGACLSFEFDSNHIWTAPLRLSELGQAMKHAHGQIQIHFNGFICDFYSAEPIVFSGPPNIKMVDFSEESLSTLKNSVDQAFRRASGTPRFFLPDNWMLEKYQVSLASNFLLRAPEHVPAIFPTSRLGVDLPLVPLALNGKYWTEVDLDDVEEMLERFYFWDVAAKPLRPGWKRFRWCDQNEDLVKKHGHEGFGEPPNGSQSTEELPIEGCRTALYTCLNLLRSPFNTKLEFARIPYFTVQLRELALAQLKEVDEWLDTSYKNRQGYEIVNAHASRICTTTMLLLEAVEATRNGIFQNPAKARDPVLSLLPNQTTFGNAAKTGSKKKSTITSLESYGDTLLSIRQLLDQFSYIKAHFDLDGSHSSLQHSVEHEDLLRWFQQEADHYPALMRDPADNMTRQEFDDYLVGLHSHDSDDEDGDEDEDDYNDSDDNSRSNDDDDNDDDDSKVIRVQSQEK